MPTFPPVPLLLVAAVGAVGVIGAAPAAAAGARPVYTGPACPGAAIPGTVGQSCDGGLLAAITVLEDSGPFELPDVGRGSDPDVDDVVTIGSGSTGLNGCDFAQRTFTSTPTGSGNEVAGSLTFDLIPDCSGLVSSTINAGDGSLGSLESATITIFVTAVNDAPTVVIGPDQVPAADGPSSVPGFATGIGPGPLNEDGQDFGLEVSVVGGDLVFDVEPTIVLSPDDSSVGDLAYSIAPGSFGTATVQVVAVDDGGTANGGVDRSAPRTFTVSRLRPGTATTSTTSTTSTTATTATTSAAPPLAGPGAPATVARPPAAAGGSLARTGPGEPAALALGVGLVVLGAGVVLASRLRRSGW